MTELEWDLLLVFAAALAVLTVYTAVVLAQRDTARYKCVLLRKQYAAVSEQRDRVMRMWKEDSAAWAASAARTEARIAALGEKMDADFRAMTEAAPDDGVDS